MTVTARKNNIEKMEANIARVATSSTNSEKKKGGRVFLWPKVDQIILLRPVYELNQCLMLSTHNKYHIDRSQSIQAICAKEIGKNCLYCEASKEDKKLTPSDVIYVPVFVYSITDTNTGMKATYQEQGPNGEKIVKPESGFRVLELKEFGGIVSVFNSWKRRPSITDRDFTLELTKVKERNSYTVIHQDPAPMNPKIRAATPSLDAIEKRLLEALPPVESTSFDRISYEHDSPLASPTTVVVEEDDIAVF